MGLASYSTRRRANIPMLYLKKSQIRFIGKRLHLTVCAGGTLEWPPAVETLTLVSVEPFSAVPTMAMMEPPMSPNMPTRAIWVNHLNGHYGAYCPRPQVVRTNLCHIFLALHQRDVGHPISNRAELRCQGVEKCYRRPPSRLPLRQSQKRER